MFDFLDPLNLGVVILVVDWTIRLIALFVVPRNRKPSSATAWLMIIFLVPTIGGLLYVLLGSPKLPADRQASQKRIDEIISDTLEYFQKTRDSKKLLSAKPPKEYEPLAKLSESLTCLPVFGGNNIELLPDYDNAIARLVKDINAAEQFVYLEYFILVLDDATEPVFKAMADAIERGVKVRVMYDALSTQKMPGKRKMLKRLKHDGVIVQSMLPIRLGIKYVRPDLRNHRKLVVIDGHTGYTGSQNLVHRNYHRRDDIYYDELVVRVRGPIVLQLAALFSSDWYSETGELLRYRKNLHLPTKIKKSGDSLAQVVPSGPGYDDVNNLKLFTELVHFARKQIVIVNPYFVPDEALMTAITSAARRGVEVIMVNSEAIDQWMVGHAQRSYYEMLLQVGVKVYLYKKPILLHSKFITVDGQVATIGSSNLDIRSFELNLEITMIVYDRKVVQSLNKIGQTYISRSHKITLKQWQNRSRRQILLENLTRLTSSLQ